MSHRGSCGGDVMIFFHHNNSYDMPELINYERNQNIEMIGGTPMPGRIEELIEVNIHDNKLSHYIRAYDNLQELSITLFLHNTPMKCLGECCPQNQLVNFKLEQLIVKLCLPLH